MWKTPMQEWQNSIEFPKPPKMPPSLSYFSMSAWSTLIFSINMCYSIIHVVNPSFSVNHVSYLSNHVIDLSPVPLLQVRGILNRFTSLHFNVHVFPYLIMYNTKGKYINTSDVFFISPIAPDCP